MNYILILCTICILTIQTLCFKEFNRSFMKNVSSYFLFNFMFFSVVVTVFVVSGVSIWGYDPATLGLGALFGVLFIVAIFCYMKAMENGPLSFTILFNSFGILIPVLSGVLFWNEPINAVQVVGLLLLFTTFYLGSGSGSAPGEKQSMNLKWLFFCIISFIGNGMIMTVTKWHQIVLPGRENKEFLVMAFGTAAVLSLLLFLFSYFTKKQVITHLRNRRLAMIVIVTGITTAFGNQLIVYLASRIPSVLQFPAINGGIVIMTTVVSALLFKDRLTRNGVIGMNLGIVSLVLLSL